MNNLERAGKSIDDLQSIVARLRSEAPREDLQPNGPDSVEKISPSRIKVEAIGPAQDAVDAIFAALTTPSGRVHRRIPGSPPIWWRDFKKVLREEGLENTASLDALRDAVVVLDPYIREETSTLAFLAFLTADVDRHLHLSPGANLRAHYDPNSNQFILVFDPEVDRQIRDAFDKLNREIVTFPKGCVSFLRDALSEARDIVT